MAATRANLERNRIDPDRVELLASTDDPEGPLDVGIVKVPRTLALLEDQLRRLRPHLHAGSVVLGAGMTQDVHRPTIRSEASRVGNESVRTCRSRRSPKQH